MIAEDGTYTLLMLRFDLMIKHFRFVNMKIVKHRYIIYEASYTEYRKKLIHNSFFSELPRRHTFHSFEELGKSGLI
jgi:hypothetical protein